MKKVIDGNAIIYCEGAYNTTNGKTAHGLVRFTERYNIIAVVDSGYAGRDAGQIIDGKKNGIPVVSGLQEAINIGRDKKEPAQYFVVGLAPDGGKLPAYAYQDIREALKSGLNIDCGLHTFLSDDRELVKLAKQFGGRIRDIRKTPGRDQLHFFTGKIEQVNCLKLALLGTDSAIGKRTSAWIMVHGFRKAGFNAQLVGTGQTAWMQGAKYTMIMDSVINDFVSGEIEHAVYEAWKNESPDVIIIEGQGSLMNPAYPGGFEILAAGRPDFVILQHAPRRLEYDGFPGYKIHPLTEQIRAIEVVSGRKVIAVTVNHEEMQTNEIEAECDRILQETGLPAFDVLVDGPDKLVDFLKRYIKE